MHSCLLLILFVAFSLARLVVLSLLVSHTHITQLAFYLVSCTGTLCHCTFSIFVFHATYVIIIRFPLIFYLIIYFHQVCLVYIFPHPIYYSVFSCFINLRISLPNLIFSCFWITFNTFSSCTVFPIFLPEICSFFFNVCNYSTYL